MVSQGYAVQFPDISPPVMMDEYFFQCLRDRNRGTGDGIEEIGEQVRDIRWPVVEGWQGQAQGVDAEKEVAPECPFADGLDDIGIAGGNGEFLFFAKGKPLYKVSPEQVINTLLDEVEKL